MPVILEQRRSSAISVAPVGARRDEREIPVITLILWTGCLAVGILGVVLPYARPVPTPKPTPVVKAEILHIDLTRDSLPPITPPQELSATQPPSFQQPPAAIPEVPPMAAVAEPNAVAFALPVEGPTTLVEPAKARFAVTPVVEQKPAPIPPVQVLTYGQGEGRQPAPEYPLRARREGQEGVVGIQFSVADDGRVLSAEALKPCPWKLLNDAALRVVRERWRFPSGSTRLYEVSIRFQLTK